MNTKEQKLRIDSQSPKGKVNTPYFTIGLGLYLTHLSLIRDPPFAGELRRIAPTLGWLTLIEILKMVPSKNSSRIINP